MRLGFQRYIYVSEKALYHISVTGSFYQTLEHDSYNYIKKGKYHHLSFEHKIKVGYNQGMRNIFCNFIYIGICI